MFSEQNKVLSVKDLMTVFRLCDPDRTGRIKIDYLQELAYSFTPQTDHRQEINNILDELDPNGYGTLSFKEFCSGIRAIRRRQKIQERKYSLRKFKKSMMSPTTAATDSTMGNGSAGPEPSFLLNPPDSPRPAEQSKSQCSSLSDGENYEWNGEGVDLDADSGISSDRNLGDGIRTRSPSSGINRHTWLRTSLRRTSSSNQDNLPNRRWGSFRHNGKRQLGSNALASDYSQLYRSSSFNSSGRSSTCDTADDMYSDASLEEDVHDLHHKFQVLQQQVGVLQDSANQNDERYTRAKSDNAALQARVIMLEEQLRDTEMRYDERLQDEQRRSREMLNRLEREKQLQLENASIRLHAAETEASNLKEEVARQRMRIEKLENERKELTDQIQELTNEVIFAKEQATSFKEKERRLNQEHEAQVQLIEELSREIERLRSEARTPALPTTSPETIRLEELHEEITNLRNKNTQLQEANDELQASLLHAGLEQGRMLTAGENSLAAELEAMTHDEPVILHDRESVAKMQQALKEQQEVNLQLRCYIDGILLNIVENYPQLLEVKHRSA
ncbi:rab11 family-interacting protein 4A isoform X1 [Tribolium madens]|uniref:rab11 family-interacting protein 4A isoform X1 n=2 Tax=Tribolium madens TaxID=41895 RepID=UPI001CF75500|nr:rab11 family-interacting protein 4A isoform X1 [Tribolium madens]